MNYLINKKLFKSKELLILNYSLLILFSSCSVSSQVSKLANKTILKDSATSKGFIGISIYDPATGKYLYNYNATKYFTPASNTKLFSLYAGMKYLGDSLVGLRYLQSHDTILFRPTGDPTFLHPDFTIQPVFDFLKKAKTIVYENRAELWKSEPFGRGWSWDDYNDDYMAERSEFPLYGNVVTVISNKALSFAPPYIYSGMVEVSPPFFKREGLFINGSELHSSNSTGRYMSAKRLHSENRFVLSITASKPTVQNIPFATSEKYFIYNLLEDTLHSHIFGSFSELTKCIGDCKLPEPFNSEKYNVLHSQPTDSLFRPMMHRSDNFFAEQTLLMVSNERLGYMSDADIIDTLLNNDLKDIPQRPKWVDGSGLSRYNLFTPQSFIYILNKLKTEFGWDRLRNILPTGGEGTLSSYFHKDSGFIYAKTGTLSNNCALSGFLLTDKGKLLIFSILANHYQGGATPIRKASERFLEAIRHRY